MNAVLLVHRHLEIFERVVHVLALELMLQDAMTEQVRVAHSVGRDRFQTREKIIRLRVLAHDLGERYLSKLIVIAVIAEGSSPLRKVLQPRLIKFFKECVLLRHSIRQ